MILSEEQAKQGVCRVKSSISLRPGPPRPNEESLCEGSRCVAYWKWNDAEHTKGYCSIAGKPEFE